ncbi:MAG TPA: hypothetical protein VKQ32_12295 [Polyangia bacterium]|nr:hypothetical protein [Polyangia bacterium]
MTERAIRFRKRRPKSALIACLAAAAVWAGAIGCGNDAADPVSNTIVLKLDFGGGVTLSSVLYVLTGPNGFRRTGTLSVGDQPTVTTTFQNLPVGQGYNIHVMGSATDDTTACRGMLTFDVDASMTATLTIPLICEGLVSITGAINVCPVIDELSALPGAVQVGGSIQLIATVRDDDGGPQPLTAMWSATGGMLSNQSLSGATFTCSAPGMFTVSLAVSDGGDASMCSAPSTVTLVCQ